MAKGRTKKNRRTLAAQAAQTPMAWIARIKYRALAYVAAIIIATIATITLVGAPWVPVVGVAVAAACMSVSKLTTRLLHPTCLECGHDLSGEPVAIQGIACPGCGAVNSPGLVQLARMGDPQGRGKTGDEG